MVEYMVQFSKENIYFDFYSSSSYIPSLGGKTTREDSSSKSNSMSSYVDATAGAVEHCEAMALEFPDLAEAYYNKIATECKQKLWHQLTLTVMKFVGIISDNNDDTNQLNTSRTTARDGVHSYLAMYDKVVCAVDSKLNPLSLARIASAVATALAVTDMTAATAVLENLLSTDKKEELGVTAVIYVQSK